MHKTTDSIPLDCPTSYYFGAGRLAYVDQDKKIVIESILEGKQTIPVLEMADNELEQFKKKLDQEFPNAEEEYLIDAGRNLKGLFRWSK